MNSVLLHVLILWAVLATALGLLWLFRQLGVSLAPLPGAGVFGFIGAAFGVVIGLTVYFASQHYMTVRTDAQGEATQLATISAMSEAFPARAGSLIRRDVYCYVTDVIDDEWPAMEGGDERGSPKVDARLAALDDELLHVGQHNPPQPSTWYSNAISAAITAEQDRGQRLLLGASAQIPNVMWVLVYFGAALMVVFALFFHMKSRRQLVWMTVAVIIMLTVLTGVLAALDHPTQRPFGIGPQIMRTLQTRLSNGLPISSAIASSAAKC